MKQLIIFISDTDGGVATYIRTFLQFHSPDRFRVRVVIVNDRRGKNTLQAKEFKSDEVLFFYFDDYENLFHVIKRLALCIDGPEDVLLCNERLELTMVNLLRLPNPVVNVIHGDSDYYYNSVSRYNGIVNGFLATSTFIERKARQLLNNNTVLCRKILAPVPFFTGGPGRSGGPLQIVYVGRLDKSKGVHHIAGICRLLEENSVNYEVTVIGQGDYLNQLREESEQLKASFIFRGFVPNDQLERELSGKDVFLFPSYSEALGIVVVEAMKMGIIPVVSDLPSGIPEFVINGETGFTAPVGNEIAFASHIRWVATHPDEAALLKQKAIGKANLLFDPGKQAAAIDDFLREASAVKKAKTFTIEQYGFRLDSPVIPNWLTVLIRKMRKLVRVKPWSAKPFA